MYAIIEAGGRQWRVEPGTRLEINRITAEVGAPHAVTRVLMAQDGVDLKIGCPYLEGAQVVCEVLEHPRGPKVLSYHYRRRENWRKTVGHRQELTRLLVKEIHLEGSRVAALALTEPGHPPQAGRRGNAAAEGGGATEPGTPPGDSSGRGRRGNPEAAGRGARRPPAAKRAAARPAAGIEPKRGAKHGA